MKKLHYDVFILGTGNVGHTVADACADAGKKVGIIDTREYGGTCSQRGCDPKKVMYTAAVARRSAAHLQGCGLTEVPGTSWSDLIKTVATYIDPVPSTTREDFEKKGIDCYTGEAKFTGENSLAWDDTEITADHIVIGTGQKPRELEEDFVGREHAVTHETFFHMEELPKRIAFLGAGYIAMEFGQIAAAFGAQVFMLDHGKHILSPFDSYLADMVQEQSEEDLDMTIKTETSNERIEKVDDHYVLYYTQDGKEHSTEADIIFNTTGRVPAIDTLDLDAAGIDYDDKGIITNKWLRTSNKNVWAGGDVNKSDIPLTPVAGIHAKAIKENIFGNMTAANVPITASVSFVYSNLAGVGMGEKEADESGKSYRSIKMEIGDWFNAKRYNTKYYAFHILIEDGTDIILGAHILGPHAADQINIFALAVNNELTKDGIQQALFTYPTWTNDIKGMLAEFDK